MIIDQVLVVCATQVIWTFESMKGSRNWGPVQNLQRDCLAWYMSIFFTKWWRLQAKFVTLTRLENLVWLSGVVQGWGSPLNIVFFYNGVSNNGSYPIVVSINSCRVLARLRDARPGKGDGGRGGSLGSFDCSLGRSPPIYPLYISYISPIYFLYISYIFPIYLRGKGTKRP